MSYKTYLKMHIKRAFTFFPAIFIITSLMLSTIAATVAVVLYSDAQSDGKKKITLGIVGNVDEGFLDVGIAALENMDSSRFYVKFDTMSEDSAKRKLKNRRITGYVHIPDDFIDSIMYGENKPLKVYFNKADIGLGSALAEEAALCVSELVTEAQISAYAAYELAEDMGLKKIGSIQEKLNIQNIKLALKRGSAYKIEYVGIKDNLTYGGYYICGFIVFFLLLWGISCTRLLSSKNYELLSVMCAKKHKPCIQYLCDYAGFLVVTLTALSIFTLIFGTVVSYNDFGIRELSGAGVVDCIGFVIKILPVIIMFTLMHMLIYEIFSSRISSVIVQFIIAVGLGYISGCFYPNTFFPQPVQNVAEILPVGAGFAYLRCALSHNNFGKEFALVMTYSLAFCLAGFLLRRQAVYGEKI